MAICTLLLPVTAYTKSVEVYRFYYFFTMPIHRRKKMRVMKSLSLHVLPFLYFILYMKDRLKNLRCLHHMPQVYFNVSASKPKVQNPENTYITAFETPNITSKLHHGGVRTRLPYIKKLSQWNRKVGRQAMMARRKSNVNTLTAAPGVRHRTTHAAATAGGRWRGRGITSRGYISEFFLFFRSYYCSSSSSSFLSPFGFIHVSDSMWFMVSC